MSIYATYNLSSSLGNETLNSWTFDVVNYYPIIGYYFPIIGCLGLTLQGCLSLTCLVTRYTGFTLMTSSDAIGLTIYHDCLCTLYAAISQPDTQNF